MDGWIYGEKYYFNFFLTLHLLYVYQRGAIYIYNNKLNKTKKIVKNK